MVSGLGLRVLSLGPRFGGLGRRAEGFRRGNLYYYIPTEAPVVGAMNLDRPPYLKGQYSF